LIIQTTTSRGFAGPHSFEFPRGSTFDYNLTYGFDEMVRWNYNPRIQEAGAVSSLISRAIMARGYLCFLFSTSPIVEYERVIHGEHIEEHASHRNNLGLHLLGFILARLDALISEIASAVGDLNGNHDYNLDVEAAVGILYAGLMHVAEGLRRGILRPLCVCWRCYRHDLSHELLTG
jgi:hypothetical protein